MVLWELFSLGKTPYPGIEPGQELYEKLLKNYRMAQPQFCPHNIYKIMLECWNAEPKERPRFREMADILGTKFRLQFHCIFLIHERPSLLLILQLLGF